jgi:hypothetical protein
LTERRLDGSCCLWWTLSYRDLTLRAAVVEEDIAEQLDRINQTQAAEEAPATAFIRRFSCGIYGTLVEPYDGQLHGVARDVLVALAYRAHPDWFASGLPVLRFTVDPAFPIPLHDGEISGWPAEKQALYREFVTAPERFIRIERIAS